jgi:hypothetical protein
MHFSRVANDGDSAKGGGQLSKRLFAQVHNQHVFAAVRQCVGKVRPQSAATDYDCVILAIALFPKTEHSHISRSSPRGLTMHAERHHRIMKMGSRPPFKQASILELTETARWRLLRSHQNTTGIQHQHRLQRRFPLDARRRLRHGSGQACVGVRYHQVRGAFHLITPFNLLSYPRRFFCRGLCERIFAQAFILAETL